MTKTELNKFRTALELQRTELESGSGDREALAINSSPEDLDRIQHASDRDLVVSNLERSSSRLRDVRAALLRLDRGTFGACVECAEDMNPKRLAALPWAPLCIACQEAADREQSAPGNEFETPVMLSA